MNIEMTVFDITSETSTKSGKTTYQLDLRASLPSANGRLMLSQDTPFAGFSVNAIVTVTVAATGA